MGVNQITVNFRALPSRTISVDEFYEFYEENTDLFAQMTPTVSVSATVKHESDTMSSTSVGGYGEGVQKVTDMFRQAGLCDVELSLYEGYRHEILNEIGKEKVFEDLRDWMLNRI
jgi:alpha-beta hydrolase superfamily lysophospholipase